MIKTFVLAVVLAAFGAVASALSGQSAEQAPRISDSPKIIRPTGGCNLPRKPSGDFHFTTTDGRGTARDYEVLVPSVYDPATAWALTFVYHGRGQTQAGSKSFGLQNAPGAAASSIFVFPQGVNYLTYGIGWDESASGYDMVFFDNMLAALEANYCIDTMRVFVAGFSWGCDQVTALICNRGNRIRAVAAASCSDGFRNPADYRTYQSCRVKSSAAIRFTHDASGGDSGYARPLFATTSALYRSFNSCSNASIPVSPNPCRAYVGCANPVVECPYAGLGHALPASWAADTWNFFSTFR